MSNEWNWPDWVPAEVRMQIEETYSQARHYSRTDWELNAKRNNMPEFGQRVIMRSLGKDAPCVCGRYVHAWNNIGRVITDDGTVEYVSNPRPLIILGDVPHNWAAV